MVRVQQEKATPQEAGKEKLLRGDAAV